MSTRSVILSVVLALFLMNGITMNLYSQSSTKYKWMKGEKFLIHKVVAKETWSGLARKYNITMSDLMQANPGVTDLKIGQILNVPIKQEAAGKSEENKNEQKKPTGTAAIYYTIKPRETLFTIAKNNNTTPDNLKKWNAIEDNNIKAGQKIIIGYVSSVKPAAEVQHEPLQNTEQPDKVVAPAKVPETAAKTDAIQLTEINKDINPAEKRTELNPAVTKPAVIERTERVKEDKPVLASTNKVAPIIPEPAITTKEIRKSGDKILSQISETGICSWINEGENQSSRFYALHRTAPIGTIMKVTNKMNGKSVFVKVVGTLPNSGDNDKVIVKLSQTAVHRLGALDDHFQVELSYGMMN
ncbi:MAG: LysM peptidoglycan-binding domain-containing protein [Bacteroidia bacterium]|nr:LysM peptidoglycan-binding domain-containing protein [Bacteroidia bacterium]MCZ2276865.1 LysM peptidoglycan-binding domain-containing protein [Bacteroidia bacterium]